MGGAGAPGILKKKVKQTMQQIKSDKKKKSQLEKNNMESLKCELSSVC